MIRRMQLPMASMLSGGGDAYWERVLNADPANLYAFYPTWELAGVTADDLSSENNNGTYNGVTLGQPGQDGFTCPLFTNGVSRVDLPLSFAADFAANAPVAGRILMWGKILNAGALVDGLVHDLFRIRVNSSNEITVRKGVGNNTLDYIVRNGAVLKQVNKVNFTTTAWFCVAMRWEYNVTPANSIFKAFFNGMQEGATQTGVGLWVGSPGIRQIGANSTAPTSWWTGWLQYIAFWKGAGTDAFLQGLSVI